MTGERDGKLVESDRAKGRRKRPLVKNKRRVVGTEGEGLGKNEVRQEEGDGERQITYIDEEYLQA